MSDTITGRRRRRGKLNIEAVLITAILVLAIIGLLVGAIEISSIPIHRF